MLYRTIKRLIEKGQTEGLQEKVDVLYAAGRLSTEEYNELSGMLNGSAETP